MTRLIHARLARHAQERPSKSKNENVKKNTLYKKRKKKTIDKCNRKERCAIDKKKNRLKLGGGLYLEHGLCSKLVRLFRSFGFILKTQFHQIKEKMKKKKRELDFKVRKTSIHQPFRIDSRSQ